MFAILNQYVHKKYQSKEFCENTFLLLLSRPDKTRETKNKVSLPIANGKTIKYTLTQFQLKILVGSMSSMLALVEREWKIPEKPG